MRGIGLWNKVFVPAIAALAFSAAAAHAGGVYPYEERVHADSYGNLVIYSPAGYKRIVVGQGHLAAEYIESRQYAPRVVYLEDDRRRERRTFRTCNREPVLLHGRSYMYGLPDNVVPVPAGICE